MNLESIECFSSSVPFRWLKTLGYEFTSEVEHVSYESLVCPPINISCNTLLGSTSSMQRDGQWSSYLLAHLPFSILKQPWGHSTSQFYVQLALPLWGSLSWTETVPVTNEHPGNSYRSPLYHEGKVVFWPSLKKCTEIRVTLGIIWSIQSQLGLTRSLNG